jgi:hypothetical protein
MRSKKLIGISAFSAFFLLFLGACTPTAEIQSASQVSPTAEATEFQKPTSTPAPATATPIPPPPDKPADTLPSPSSSESSTSSGLYRVVWVAENDSLNVRSGPGVQNDIAGTFPYDAGDIRITGAAEEKDNVSWVPVIREGITGWVRDDYLTEQVEKQQFCGDKKAYTLLNSFFTAIEKKDGAVLEKVISPRRGLLIRLNWWNPEVRIPPKAIPILFDDKTPYKWGAGEGSGLATEGSFADIILPSLSKDLAGQPQVLCNELAGGPTTGLIKLPPEYQNFHYFAVYRPGSKEQELDWGTWAVGFEYNNSEPVIIFLVHYNYEI